MQYLRDNLGVLEASNNGTDWEPVVLGEGGGPLTNPFTLGDIQIREDSGELQMSSDSGTTWTRVWDTGATFLNLQGKELYPQIISTDTQPGTWSLSIGAIALWWEPTAQKLWLIYWRAQDEWYRMQLTPDGTVIPSTLSDTVNLGAAGTVRISNVGNLFNISEDGGSTFTRPVFPADLNEITLSSTGFIDVSVAEFYPPLVEDDTEPAQDGLIVWHDTTVSAEKWYLVYREGTTNHKVELT
jgi:hypothetical protein